MLAPELMLCVLGLIVRCYGFGDLLIMSYLLDEFWIEVAIHLESVFLFLEP